MNSDYPNATLGGLSSIDELLAQQAKLIASQRTIAESQLALSQRQFRKERRADRRERRSLLRAIRANQPEPEPAVPTLSMAEVAQAAEQARMDAAGRTGVKATNTASAPRVGTTGQVKTATGPAASPFGIFGALSPVTGRRSLLG